MQVHPEPDTRTLSIPATTGWDIGGVHLKVARPLPGHGFATGTRPLSIQHELEALPHALRELHGAVAGRPDDIHAVTMTAELSQRFRLKRDGVNAVLDAMETAFPGSTIRVFAVDGRFLDPPTARTEPVAVAASNWAATAALVARANPDCILVDIGSTTTDIIPIVGGRVAARGATDPERLRHDELVYTGVVRTPVEAVVSTVPWRDGPTGVSADGFATTGDVHLWLGRIGPEDWTVPTPDGRPASRPFAGERLARVVCGDRSLVTDPELDRIAASVARAQLERIAAALGRVRQRHPDLGLAVVAGLGEWLAAEAAREVGLEVVPLGLTLGGDAARIAPAAAVAILADPAGTMRPATPPDASEAPGIEGATGVLMVKVGGGLAAQTAALDRVAGVLGRLSSRRRIVIFPGGGPFAERVREFDRTHGLSPDAAHWMAILAMDQYARVLVDRIPGAALVTDQPGMDRAHAAGQVPVLAPARWLMATDELPSTWDVTSDSLAAYTAMLLGLDELVLLKPARGGIELLDPYFGTAAPAGLRWRVVALEDVEGLLSRPDASAAASPPAARS